MGSGTSGGEGKHINRVSVRSLDGECGIRIDDRIQRRHCEIRTDRPSDPTPADDSQFNYPVDTAVELTAGRLTFEGFSRTFVHDGTDVTEVEYFESVSFDDGHYTLELSGPVKLYVELEGAIDVQTTVSEMDVTLSEAASVRIGARSYHEQPAATVTTTDDPTNDPRPPDEVAARTAASNSIVAITPNTNPAPNSSLPLSVSASSLSVAIYR